MPVAPDERQDSIARQVVERVLPGLVVEEIRVAPGWVEDDGSHVADAYVVRAHSEEDTRPVIAWEFSAATQTWVEEGITWDTEGLSDTSMLEELPDGTEYLYWTGAFDPVRERSADSGYLELLVQVSVDWPGSVTTWASWEDPATRDSAYVYPTTWEQFADDRAFDGFEALYVREGDGWRLEGWTAYATSVE
jgi:hypothetical protein